MTPRPVKKISGSPWSAPVSQTSGAEEDLVEVKFDLFVSMHHSAMAIMAYVFVCLFIVLSPPNLIDSGSTSLRYLLTSPRDSHRLKLLKCRRYISQSVKLLHPG